MHDTRLPSFARTPRKALAALLLCSVAIGCSSSDDDDSPSGAGGAANGGASTSWGGFSFGGFTAQGGGAASLGGFSSTTFGGTPSSSGGKSGGANAGGSLGTGGGIPSAGTAGLPPATIPPPPGPDGKSPYLAECHGDTRTCVDVVNLTCLGIKDPAVRGYSCSSSCQTNADCSQAPSGFPASAACVDFAVSKHCLFVCLERGETRACPTGMSCYVYTGSPTGYCLWPP